MRKVTYGVLGSVLFVSGLAFAASPSEEQCIADGGTFVRDGGQVYCELPKNNGNGSSTCTDGSNGTLNNDPQASKAGPGGGSSASSCK